ncbi:MAG: sigma-70 family RNA polymerase sigma factor [Actinomycetota bacterium]
MEPRSAGQLFEAARTGDSAAWNELVDRMSPAIWAAGRAYALSEAETADVFQHVWLRLVEHRDRISEPEAVPGWIRTTARREALRLRQLADRSVEPPSEDIGSLDPGPPDEVVSASTDRLLLDALRRLGDRCRELLWMLFFVPDVSYDSISADLDMPVGAIGPTRSRCLAQLRADPAVQGLWSDV